MDYKRKIRLGIVFVFLSVMALFIWPKLKKNSNKVFTIKTCVKEENKTSEKIIDTVFTLPLYSASKSSILLGDIRKLKLIGDTIWILDSNYNLFAFLKNGKLIAKINQNIEGPGGLLQVSDFEIFGDKIYTLEMSKPFLQTYDKTNFKFIKNIHLSNEYNYSDLLNWKGNWYFFCPSLFSNRPIHVYSPDFTLKEKKLYHSINTQKFLAVPPQPFAKTIDGISINMMFNDTIFLVNTNEEISARYYIDLCGRNMNKKLKTRFENSSQPEIMKLITQNLSVINYKENDEHLYLETFRPNIGSNIIVLDKKNNLRKTLNQLDTKKYQPLSFNFIGIHKSFFISSFDEGQVNDFTKTSQFNNSQNQNTVGVLQFVKFSSFKSH